MKERILQLIDFKGINKHTFIKKTGIANGFFKSSGGVNSENIEKIISAFPDVNISWLVTGKGDMINSRLKAGMQRMSVPLIDFSPWQIVFIRESTKRQFAYYFYLSHDSDFVNVIEASELGNISDAFKSEDTYSLYIKNRSIRFEIAQVDCFLDMAQISDCLDNYFFDTAYDNEEKITMAAEDESEYKSYAAMTWQEKNSYHLQKMIELQKQMYGGNRATPDNENKKAAG